ncbi:MAG: hypothetical protein ACHQO8_04050 [Vicinamibacterales bacterium]
MAEALQRPVFYEGQILAATDLTATVDYDREQLARHDRLLHTWGIADGLMLEKKDPKKVNGVDVVTVMLNSGLAIDGAGLAVLVPETVPLSEDDFNSQHVADPQNASAWYPVLLVGAESAPPQAALSTQACGASNQQNRTIEAYSIVFGRPGTAIDLDTQIPPAAGDPASPVGADRWRVLLGFVQWNKDQLRFTDAADTADGATRRYAGVRASEVSAHAGQLTLRSRERTAKQKVAVRLDDTDAGGKVTIGLEDDRGVVTPLVTVNAKGDLTAVGKISAGGSQAGVYVESGIATDGMRLPLPVGITQAQVDQGKVQLHYHVTPRLSDLTSPPAVATVHPLAVTPLRCTVDDMRVSCAARWLFFDAAATPPVTHVDVPAPCDYLVMAVIPSGT